MILINSMDYGASVAYEAMAAFAKRGWINIWLLVHGPFFRDQPKLETASDSVLNISNIVINFVVISGS